MNIKATMYYLAMVLKLVAILLFIPGCISLHFREYDAVKGFLITIGLAVACAVLLDTVRTMKEKRMRPVHSRDSFVLVAICWLCLSVFGALPYYFSEVIPSLVNALFESVSGFTTTGATILTEIESLPRGILFWRCLTQWMGGMGVLVLLLAASSAEHSVYVMKAEIPGPSPGKLVPRLRQSSMILYGIYVSLTMLQVLFLIIGGMPLYDSLCCAMSTAGTGGLFITNNSLAFYNNVYYEMITAWFMFLFGINFNIMFFLLMRNFRAVWRNEEFRVYVGIFSGSILVISVNLLLNGVYKSLPSALRYATFQVSSLMTTTAFRTTDYDVWPQFSRWVLMIIMVIGASAGSTSGGFKVSRLIILLKEARRSTIQTANPHAVGIVKLDGKALDVQVRNGVLNYFAALCSITFMSALAISLDDFDFESTFTAVLACIGNVGVGLGMVSPSGNFSAFSDFSKVVLSFDMLVGRLEIYPMLLLFAPRTWRRG